MLLGSPISVPLVSNGPASGYLSPLPKFLTNSAGIPVAPPKLAAEGENSGRVLVPIPIPWAP